jgi:hypothetical protein
MLNWQQWRNKIDATVYWLNVAVNSQKNVFVYIRQLEFAVLHYADRLKKLGLANTATRGKALIV